MTSRVVVLAAIFILLFIPVLGVRGAVRSLAEPFAMLEGFAFAPRPAEAPEEEELEQRVRTVDWDEPVPIAPAGVRKPPVKKPRLAALALEAAMHRERDVLEEGLSSLSELAVQAVKIRLRPGLDIDSLEVHLFLSASQKERISALMDWRKRALEAPGADHSRIEAAYETAIALELDHGQFEAYRKLKSGHHATALSVLLERAVETKALKFVGQEEERVTSPRGRAWPEGPWRKRPSWRPPR